jgi:hypothetical protein
VTSEPKPKEFSIDVRRRAVRIVLEHLGEYTSPWAAIVSIAAKIADLMPVRLNPFASPNPSEGLENNDKKSFVLSYDEWLWRTRQDSNL